MTTTLADFITGAGISMTAEETDHNPHMEDGGDKMDHWRVTMRAGRSRMTLTFSMGSAHHGKAPEIANVLDCLASDASGFENARTFEEWCSEYGYNTRSRKAERTFRVVKQQSERLKTFLGDSAYKTLLWDCGRE